MKKIYFFIIVFGFFCIGSCKNPTNDETKYIPVYSYTFKEEVRKALYLSDKKQAEIEYIVSYETMEELKNYYESELGPWLNESQESMLMYPSLYAVELQKIYNTANLFGQWIVMINDLDIIRNDYFIYRGE